ncbi:MAG TPA: glycosyltransferase family 4 protein [Pyrinomonadaceae bacterium]|nr:glycosyltransferase family 4 protein [Pyrinomonadaceae bacterium]
MTLTILSVAYPLAPVGPDAVGGAEQILTYIDEALVRAGHRSIVIACEGSKTYGTLVPIRIFGSSLAETLELTDAQQRLAIKRILAEYSVDVVHMHGLNFLKYMPSEDVPVVVTLHLPPSYYPPETFSLRRPKTFLHCVSQSQRRSCPPHAQLLPGIENGVPFAGRNLPHAKRKFCVALGRICPEKGFHFAITAAELAQRPLLIGGQIFNFITHQEYFEKEIAPRCKGKIRFIGPAGLMRKRRLLAAAHCLLVPSLAPETSSLVAMESLACGTPVIAFPSGALPEIVEHGRTGFIVKDEREMAEAICEAGSLDRQVCMETARRRFPVERMVERYFETYSRLAHASQYLSGEEHRAQTCGRAA